MTWNVGKMGGEEQASFPEGFAERQARRWQACRIGWLKDYAATKLGIDAPTEGKTTQDLVGAV